MSKLVFELPNAQTPGYLRRAKKGLEFKGRMAQGTDPTTIDDMVNFLVDFVSEPEDRDEARNGLLDASEEQFTNLIDLITGENKEENPTVNGKPSTKSEQQEKDKKP